MTSTLVIIHVNDDAHRAMARKLVESYRLHPPGVPHRTLVVCQDGQPTEEIVNLFGTFIDVTLHHRHGQGQDIGAYLDVAKLIDTDVMICFGGSTFVRREGWMKRMLEAVEKHGPGFYGPTASYQKSPHLNTTGFWCPPKLLAEYPIRVVTHEDRYSFEHGKAFWKYVAWQKKLPVKLVTWCGEYDWPQWRTPEHIYHRGDQSNCLTYFRASINYQLASPHRKREYEITADTITDRAFLRKA